MTNREYMINLLLDGLESRLNRALMMVVQAKKL